MQYTKNIAMTQLSEKDIDKRALLNSVLSIQKEMQSNMTELLIYLSQVVLSAESDVYKELPRFRRRARAMQMVQWLLDLSVTTVVDWEKGLIEFKRRFTKHSFAGMTKYEQELMFSVIYDTVWRRYPITSGYDKVQRTQRKLDILFGVLHYNNNVADTNLNVGLLQVQDDELLVLQNEGIVRRDLTKPATAKKRSK